MLAINKSFSAAAGLLLFLFTASSVSGADFVLHVDVQESLQFTSSQSSLNFTFPNAEEGAVSDTVDVTYSVISNNAGRTQGLVSVRLDEEFEGIELQAQAGTFQKHGGNAALVPAAPGFVNVSSSEVSLADKTVDAEQGKLIDGALPVTYRAVLTRPQPAGQHVRTLTISFMDN